VFSYNGKNQVETLLDKYSEHVKDERVRQQHAHHPRGPAHSHGRRAAAARTRGGAVHSHGRRAAAARPRGGAAHSSGRRAAAARTRGGAAHSHGHHAAAARPRGRPAPPGQRGPRGGRLRLKPPEVLPTRSSRTTRATWRPTSTPSPHLPNPTGANCNSPVAPSGIVKKRGLQREREEERRA